MCSTRNQEIRRQLATISTHLKEEKKNDHKCSQIVETTADRGQYQRLHHRDGNGPIIPLFKALLTAHKKHVTIDYDAALSLVTHLLFVCLLSKIKEWYGVRMLLRCSVSLNKGVVENGFCCCNIAQPLY